MKQDHGDNHRDPGGSDQGAEQPARRDEEGGWDAVDPGFSLPVPDVERIDPRFYARLGDPDRIDPGFHLRPPKRRPGQSGTAPPV